MFFEGLSHGETEIKRTTNRQQNRLYYSYNMAHGLPVTNKSNVKISKINKNKVTYI